MLAREENERVTRVGRGTPMGEAMRRYWIPALLAWELPEPDCPPVRVKLLGEELVAFRDSQGRIGILDERCPHRQASLFLGRDEECGLRCVYHGWKFDVEGRCVDMMNEPEELRFAHKIRTGAYPTVEAGGIIWVYLGPAERRPAPPHFAWTQAPASHRHVSKVIQESNWLQGLEGGIDTSHVPIVHRPPTHQASLERRLGNGPMDVDQTTFRSKRNRENNYLLDRRVQKTETFTGIDGVNAQDRAVQESMGGIVDRTREHLGPADKAVIQARRLLLQATRTVEDGGTPPGVEPTYYTLHPAEAVLPREVDWRTLVAPDAPRPEVLQRA